METTTVAVRNYGGVGLGMYSVRWGAVFASLAVGLSVHLLLMILGVAGGLTAWNVAEPGQASPRALTMAAGVWDTVSLIVSAFIGGLVAGRACGLRRLSDGMVHGAVAWGATTLVMALLTTGVLSGATASLMQSVSPNTALTRSAPAQLDRFPEALRQLQNGNRSEAIAEVQRQTNLDTTQSERVVDWLLTLRGTPEQANPANVAQTERVVETASIASWWLFAAIVLSLITSVFGGGLGVRSSVRRHPREV